MQVALRTPTLLCLGPAAETSPARWHGISHQLGDMLGEKTEDKTKTSQARLTRQDWHTLVNIYICICRKHWGRQESTVWRKTQQPAQAETVLVVVKHCVHTFFASVELEILHHLCALNKATELHFIYDLGQVQQSEGLGKRDSLSSGPSISHLFEGVPAIALEGTKPLP